MARAVSSPLSRQALFVDTAGWMAMADAADPAHQASRRERDLCLEGGGNLVSTDYVIDETLTLIRVRLGLRAAAEWWAQIDASFRIRWERIDASRAEKARTRFFEWTDKDFSFTDCTSFVVMQELGLAKALTTDRHFSQAGFETVPRVPDRRRQYSLGE
ncbi:MAG: type II toxin-antitoxin system VapC family toxin [Gemmatimonadetes bacterium]|nr:PIN domain-containing protein [Gemmatimonadota bacterium]MYA41054.1 type II toxin-antitoxin system VapC family toxin [Gemmatimonadota bacterium]MYE93084.1 type II toxin-antitoxin system VapC family toxin [Gemmatimonadota bacterium]MYJ10111.1 type II toxin-antitoxin system VapC family toxin [Gemmatimonadota bacterium]